jgi:hypothetical protein
MASTEPLELRKHCKKMIGKKAIDKTTKREGIVESVGFNNKAWTICWFVFRWEKGAYLRSIEELEIAE